MPHTRGAGWGAGQWAGVGVMLRKLLIALGVCAAVTVGLSLVAVGNVQAKTETVSCIKYEDGNQIDFVFNFDEMTVVYGVLKGNVFIVKSDEVYFQVGIKDLVLTFFKINLSKGKGYIFNVIGLKEINSLKKVSIKYIKNIKWEKHSDCKMS